MRGLPACAALPGMMSGGQDARALHPSDVELFCHVRGGDADGVSCRGALRMTLSDLPDPVVPHARFQNYVLPDDRRPTVLQRLDRAVAGFRMSVPALAIFAFVLGGLSTLQLTRPLSAGISAAPPPRIAFAGPLQLAAPPVVPEVTRQATIDLLSPFPDTAPRAKTAPRIGFHALPGERESRRPGPAPVQAGQVSDLQEAANRKRMRMLREAVLAGAYTVTATRRGGGQQLKLEPVNLALDRQSIGNLLLEASLKEELEIPATLGAANGQIDLDTLLFQLVRSTLERDGTPEGQQAATDMQRHAEVALAAAAPEGPTDGARLYTVAPGDSLALIALQFYGRTDDYLLIFQANRDTLSSPDLIKVGQRLIIPG